MRIETGRGGLALAALLGIWSVSALTSLPGLAVSPILDKLAVIFPHSSELDVQMLTSLPSLMIIPFVLLAGHFTERVGYIRLLVCGLSLFLLSGVLYFFCTEMWQLIAVSALLGVGAGIIVPLSTALISRFFVGEYRTRQFGYSSAITNVMLVLATALTGYLANVQWRLPFVVYLFPIFSILLIPALNRADRGIAAAEDKSTDYVCHGGEIDYRHLVGYMIYYLLITYLTIIISFNLPFLMGEYGHGSGAAGVMISLFFLAIMMPGFFLQPILRVMKGRVESCCLTMIAVGLLIIYMYNSLITIAAGCIITGVGYGIAQPYLYDRTADVASPQRVSFALALLMAMNYVAILVCPFFVDYMQDLSHVKSERFAFGLNVVIAVLALFVMLVYRVVKLYK